MLVTFIYVGSWQKKGVDYLFAIFPAWILMLSFWLEEIWIKIEKRTIVKNLFVIIVFLPSLLMGIYQNVQALNQDTRELATEWIKKNMSKNLKLCYDHSTFDLGLFDVQRYTHYGAGSAQLPDEIKRRVVNYKNHPRNISNVPILNPQYAHSHNTDNPYEAEIAEYCRKSLSDLQDEQVTYLVTNSWFYVPYEECDIEKFSPVMRKRIKEVRDFYKDVKSKSKKVVSFQPDFWKPGPLIEIYDISQK
jgi:hypothetical protein